MQYRPEIGHALANFAFAAVLTSSCASLAFSKYRRAQIAPLSGLYCICRSNSLIVIVLLSAGFHKYRRAQIVPLSGLYCVCRSNSLIVIVFLSAGFRKYRQAQISILSGLYCICHYNSLIVIVLLSAGFQQVPVGSDFHSFRSIGYPTICLHRKISLLPETYSSFVFLTYFLIAYPYRRMLK